MIRRYKTAVLYLAFGGLTTLINLIVYFSLTKILAVQYIFANVIAWTASVLFAYVTNRLFVFASKGKGLIFIFRECSAFISSRLFSGLMDTATMYVMINLLHLNDLLVKTTVNISVIILNYVLSKRIVFQDKGQGDVGYEQNINSSPLL